MIKDKISSQEIVELIALKASISKRAAEEFLKALFLSIEEALLLGESVKIKQLGTFKLQWIEPRKSVNVRTGEDVVLAGYYKVNFTPEASLKALVNEPFAHLEAIELDGQQSGNNHATDTSEEAIDPLRIFTEQASEISSLLSEIQALSTNKHYNQIIPTSIDNVSDEFVSEEEFDVDTDTDSDSDSDTDQIEDSIDDDILEDVHDDESVEDHFDEQLFDKDESIVSEEETAVLSTSPTAQQNLVVTEPKFVAPVFEDVSKSIETDSDTKFNLFMKEVKPLRKRKSGILLLTLMIIFGGIALWIYNPPTKEFVQSIVANSESFFKPPVVKKLVRKKLVIVHRRYFQQTIPTEMVKMDSLQILFDNERVYTKFIGSERIAEGSRLARMSLRYYGCSDFWVYIYEANKAKIPNPDHIPFGTMIRIPKLDARLIDSTNPRCMKKARELHDLYVKKVTDNK